MKGKDGGLMKDIQRRVRAKKLEYGYSPSSFILPLVPLSLNPCTRFSLLLPSFPFLPPITSLPLLSFFLPMCLLSNFPLCHICYPPLICPKIKGQGSEALLSPTQSFLSQIIVFSLPASLIELILFSYSHESAGLRIILIHSHFLLLTFTHNHACFLPHSH